MGFLIAAIIIFALFQRHKYRRISDGRCDKRSRRWERMQSHEDARGQTGRAGEDKWDKWTRQWQEWERCTRDARDQTAELGLKVASKLAGC